MATTAVQPPQQAGAYCDGSSCAQQVQAAVKLLSGAWAVPVLEALALAPAQTCRFRELQRRAPGISQKELSRCLGEFVAADIVRRLVLKAQHVEYRLSARGHGLLAIADTLGRWEKGRGTEAGQARSPFGPASWLAPLMSLDA